MRLTTNLDFKRAGLDWQKAKQALKKTSTDECGGPDLTLNTKRKHRGGEGRNRLSGRNKKTDHIKKKAKAHINLKLPKEIKGNKGDFSKFLKGKRKGKTNVNPLLIGAGSLKTRDKAEVSTAFFDSVFSGKSCSQASSKQNLQE